MRANLGVTRGAPSSRVPLPSAIKSAEATVMAGKLEAYPTWRKLPACDPTVQSAIRPDPNSTDRRTWLHHSRPVLRNQYRK